MQAQQRLDRRRAVSRLLANRDRLLVVSGLGSPTYDCAAAGDHPHNFYLWGSMGSAVMVGLGLALAQPNYRVLVVTGDGEMLMGLGSLATVAVKKPRNLCVVVLDNEHYGETGMQKTHTHSGVDIAAIASNCGFPVSVTVRTEAELEAAASKVTSSPGPVCAVLKISAEKYPLVLPSWDGSLMKNRFRHAIQADGKRLDDGNASASAALHVG